MKNPKESLEMSKQRKQSTEAAVRDIRRRTRRKFSPEEKIRIGLPMIGSSKQVQTPSVAPKSRKALHSETVRHKLPVYSV